jgi:DNA-directed RNA polymerase sigma subunit (sigma70/sigma32)
MVHIQGLADEDMTVAGWEGLKNAAARWEPSRNIRFATFAMYHLRVSMRRTADKQQHMVRAPYYQKDIIRHIYDKYGAAVLQDTEQRKKVLAEVRLVRAGMCVFVRIQP